MADDPTLVAMRSLRVTLQAEAGSRGIWPTLLERFPDPQVQVALDLAYEIGYEEGGDSAWADFHEDNPEAVRLAREILGLPEGNG
jgi:hypothetical protein